MSFAQAMSVITYLAVLGNVALGTFLAALPAGVTPPWWVGPGAATINALVHALPSDGLPLPIKTTAKASAILLAVFFGISACTSASNPTPVAATGNAAQQVAQICQAAAPLVAAAQAKAPDPASAAGNLLAYANASCTAAGTVAAALAPKVEPTTPAWLTSVLQGLQVAAELAPVILPLVAG